MPNTLGNYNEIFFAQEALIQLENVLGMAGRVFRGYDGVTSRQGDTIRVRRPSTFTAQDAPSVAQDLTPENVTITLDNWKEVKFKLTDKELSLSSDRLISDHIRPAAVALADKIDTVLAARYVDIPWYTTMSATPVLDDINAVREKMFDNKVPLTDDENMNFMIGGAAERAFLSALGASGMQPNQQDGAIRRGALGKLFGFNVWANQNTPNHTSGVAADAVGAVNGALAAGVTSMAIDAFEAAGTVAVGDTFELAGHTQRYVITGAETAVAGAIAALEFSPALKEAVADNTVITIHLGGASKKQNLAFHRNAFCLAMAPLSELGGQLGARVATVSDPITSLSLRSRMYYVGDDSEVHVALDCLFGVKTLDPNLAVRAYAA